jgi:FeS assembly SUF system regulator
MLRMSKLTDYGIVLLTHMAMGVEGALHTAGELADASRVPLPTASKILKEISRAGLVISHRGRHGGYSLARPAGEIAVSEIIAALEGPVALTECGEVGGGSCGIEESCPARGHWSAINDTIQRALGGLTLSALQPPLVRLGPAPIVPGPTP